MILRRFMQHLREQNWFAVTLDLMIVIVGVFLGFQVTAWNDGRADQEALRQALVRFDAEVDANLVTIATIASELDEMIPQVSRALDVLRTCETGPDAEAAVAAGLNAAQITRGLRYRTSALSELTEQPRLLNQQSDEQRRILQDLLNDLDVLQVEATFLEATPFENPIWWENGLQATSLSPTSIAYLGYDLELPVRTMALSIPVDEACEDSDLIANFYEWERMQLGLRAVLDVSSARISERRAELFDEDMESTP